MVPHVRHLGFRWRVHGPCFWQFLDWLFGTSVLDWLSTYGSVGNTQTRHGSRFDLFVKDTHHQVNELWPPLNMHMNLNFSHFMCSKLYITYIHLGSSSIMSTIFKNNNKFTSWPNLTISTLWPLGFLKFC